VCIALCTIVAHNIAQNRPDSFPPYPPDNHHISDDVYLREGATRAPIVNPPNSAQLGGIPYHSLKLYPDPYNSVGMRPRTDTHTHTDRHTDARDHNTFLVVYDICEM